MPEHEFARGWLSIPYLTPSGVTAMKFRRIGEGDGPKMLPPEGQKTRLFNTRDLFREDAETVVLCEGELDAVVCSGVLGVPAVGVPGAGQMKLHWPRCFADVSRVVVCFDNDVKTRVGKDGVEEPWNPGQAGARKWAEALPQAVVVPPPMGLDLNDWLLRDGREAVLKGLGV